MQLQTRSHNSRWRSQTLRIGLGQFAPARLSARRRTQVHAQDEQDVARKPYNGRHPHAGFTLLEMAVVLAVIGTLMALVAPVWLTIADQRRLTSSQDRVVQAIRLAQTRAEQLRGAWQTSLREVNGTVQVATHPVNAASNLIGWEKLADGIELDVAETTLPQTNGVYRVQFSHTGRVNGQLGRFTVKGKRTSQLKQCVIVSTLLGTVRRGQNQTAPDSTGRYCY